MVNHVKVSLLVTLEPGTIDKLTAEQLSTYQEIKKMVVSNSSAGIQQHLDTIIDLWIGENHRIAQMHRE